MLDVGVVEPVVNELELTSTKFGCWRRGVGGSTAASEGKGARAA
jgi:hypothetical protein